MLESATSALASDIRRDPDGVTGLQRLSGGRNNAVYRLRANAADGICVKVYRVDQRCRADREWAALSALASCGVDTVPAPLWRDATTDPPVLAMSFVPGLPISGPARVPAPSQVTAVAALHTQLQSVPLRGLLSRNERVDNWRHYVRRLNEVWPNQLRADTSDPRAENVWELLDRWRQLGDELHSVAEVPRVFSRGDSNLENWLTHEGKLYVVDFEFAGYSDAVFDAADLVEHISARAVPDGTWDAVLPTLGVAETDLPRFRAAQRTCALRWLAVLWRQRYDRAEEFQQQWDRVATLLT